MRLKLGSRWLVVVGLAGLIFAAVVFFPSEWSWRRTGAGRGSNIPTVQGAFRLDYGAYDPAGVVELSSFEESDDRIWHGTGFYDDRLAFTGKTSLELASADYRPGVAWADGLPSLDNIDHLEVSVRVTDRDDLESFTVFLGTNERPHAYRFLITDLEERWNVVRLPRSQFVPGEPGAEPAWEALNRVEFQLLSRPGRTIIANLENLRAERTARYADDWNGNIPNLIGLSVYNNQAYLLARGLGASFATLGAVPTARDFHYQAKIIPRNSGQSGLFFRGDFRTGLGYVFWMGGIEQGSWSVFVRRPGEDNKTLASGTLTNVRFKQDKPVWLAVDTKGEEVTVSLSFDGEHFTQLAQLRDASFLAGGGVGVYAAEGAESLFNDFVFSQ